MANICNIILSVLIKKNQMKISKKCNNENLKMNATSEVKEEYLEGDIMDHNKCRVCLRNGSIPIFGSEDTKDISETLKTFGGIEISEQDYLPKVLCVSCFTTLQNAVVFRNNAQHTDKLLRQSETRKPVKVCRPVSFKRAKQAEIDVEVADVDDNDNSNYSFIEPLSEKYKKHSCKKCNLDFDSFDSYLNHTRSTEHVNLKIECPVCKKQYKTYYIKKHILTHRLDPEQVHICDVCGKSFSVLDGFKKHRAIHNSELPFKCNLCPYKGRFRESLIGHMRTHTGEKPYRCEYCDSHFSTNSNLNKHLLKHKNTRDYVCDGCGRSYYIKRELQQHIKVNHWGVKDHICNICGKAFGYRKQMMSHQVNIHKREKLKYGRLPLYLQVQHNNSELYHNGDNME